MYWLLKYSTVRFVKIYRRSRPLVKSRDFQRDGKIDRWSSWRTLCYSCWRSLGWISYCSGSWSNSECHKMILYWASSMTLYAFPYIDEWLWLIWMIHWESWWQKVTKINKINKNAAYFNLFYCTAVVLWTFVDFLLTSESNSAYYSFTTVTYFNLNLSQTSAHRAKHKT